MASALATSILATSGLIGYWPMDDASIATARDRGPNSLSGSYDSDCLLGVLGIDGKPGGAVKFGEPQNLGQALTFPYNAASVSTNISVEFCIRFNRFDFPGTQIFDAYGFNGAQVFWTLAGGNAGFQLKKHSNSIMATSASSPISDTYLWHHVVITWDSTTVHIYVDGTDTAGATTSQTLVAGTTAAGTWGAAYLKAALAHGAYYNRALSSSEVSSHYLAFQSDVAWPTSKNIKFGLHQNLNISSSDSVRLAQIAAARSVHATVSRSDFRWDVIQGTSGGAYNWALYDTIVSELISGGLTTTIFVIDFSPIWANGGSDIHFVPGTSPTDAAFTTWVAAYQVFVTAAITRYKKGGVGNPHNLDIYWEVWNEPNDVNFWLSPLTPQPNGTMYGNLYIGLRSAIIAADSTAKVVFGTLTEWYDTSASSVIAQQFLLSALAVSGVAIDYASYHPYPLPSVGPDDVSTNSNLVSDVVSYYDMLCSKGFSSAKIIISELGWGVGAVTAANQAAYLTTAFNRIRDYWSGFVIIAIWYRDWNALTNTAGLYTTMPAAPSLPAQLSSANNFSQLAAPFDQEEHWGTTPI